MELMLILRKNAYGIRRLRKQRTMNLKMVQKSNRHRIQQTIQRIQLNIHQHMHFMADS
jgi:hypothetical protein